MENETGYIKLTSAKGNVIPVRYGLSALRRLCKHFECKLSELSGKINEALEEDQLELMLVLIKVGAESVVALENTVFAYNDEELLSLFDKPGVFSQLMEAFNGSFTAFSDPTITAPNDASAGKTKATKESTPATGSVSGEK
ncbi:hypothetical protein [Spirosoma foliorum]|uniref:Uncharacterized protein n=1 Tax=Spirosoma foliorum TaxID=2710596 RepID=A0A7G5H2J3_9BACT|nr:hypothetical protein [Spirosoma foliorum]QMW05335.1 hypothetical protein H3H32_10820 [Spirosoma foliorum]